MLDNLETAQACVETIQATLRHRQQPQDVTFHRCLKALRDAIDIENGKAPAKDALAERNAHSELPSAPPARAAIEAYRRSRLPQSNDQPREIGDE